MHGLWGNFRFRLMVLIFLGGSPGVILTIYLVATKQYREILLVLPIGVIAIILAWFGGDVLLVRRVNALVMLAKRLSTGDLSVRSGLANRFSILEELAQAIDQMADFLERQTATLQQQADQVTALREIAGELAVQQDLSTLLQRVVEKAMALLQVSHASISLYDPASDDLVLVTIKGFPVQIGARVRIGEGAIGISAQILQPVVVNDYRTWENRSTKFDAIPITSMVHVPMSYQNELIGVLGVAEIEPSTRKFSQTDIQLLSLIASQAASAIKIARLFEEIYQRLYEHEVISEIFIGLRVAQSTDDMLPVVLDKTMSLVDANLGSIWLYNPADKSLHQTVSNGIPNLEVQEKPGEGIIGTVFSTGEPYFTHDWKNDRVTPDRVRSKIPSGLSGAAFPIRSAQNIVGVLNMGFNVPKELTKDQIRIISGVGEIAGNAIHRTQLFEKMSNQLEWLSALHKIDLAITSSMDLENTLQVLLDQVIDQLNVDAACVLVFNSADQTLEFAASRGFTTDVLRFTRLKLGEGYAGQAALTQRTIFIPDLKKYYASLMRSPAFAAEGFVTYYAVPLVTRNQIKGVLEIFHRTALDRNQEWHDFLKMLGSQAAIAIEDAILFDDLERSNFELNLAYNSTLEGWSRALDLRDKETQGHSQRVTDMTLQLSAAMSVAEPDLIHIRRGALLHDIGKLGIPDAILLKPGPLNEDEMERIRQHPTIANELLAPITFLQPALDIPWCHHEKWDGSGYPRGLKGEEIPLAARIFAVVDVWDALISDRPYREKWPEEKARAYLREQAGKHFDPRIVETFLTMLSEEKKEYLTPGTEE